MKKRFLKVVSMMMCLTMLMMMAVGCGGNAEDESKAIEKVNITFMNGDAKLGTAEVEKGKTMDKSAYEQYESVDNAEFTGWFATPTYVEASKKDLTKDTFDEDTTLYGCFKALEVKDDTRNWYIVGESSTGLLKESSWAGSNVTDETKEQLQLKATGNNKNEYQIVIDLYEGDLAQIISDWQWDGQKGFGYVTECDETQVADGGGLAGDAKKNNIKVLVSGNYTITLTTNPENDAFDTLTIVRNGDVAE